MSVRVSCFAGESCVVCCNRSRLNKSAAHSDDHAHTNRFTTSLSRRLNDLAESLSPLACLSCSTLGFGVALHLAMYVGSAGAADRHIGVANNAKHCGAGSVALSPGNRYRCRRPCSVQPGDGKGRSTTSFELSHEHVCPSLSTDTPVARVMYQS